MAREAPLAPNDGASLAERARRAVPGIADAANARLAARRTRRKRTAVLTSPAEESLPIGPAPVPPRPRAGALALLLGSLVRRGARTLVAPLRWARAGVRLVRTSPRHHAPLERVSEFSQQGVARMLDTALLVIICAIGAVIIVSGFTTVGAHVIAFDTMPVALRAFGIVGLAALAWLMVRLGIDVVRWFFTEVGVGYWALTARVLAVAFAALMMFLFFPMGNVLVTFGLRDGADASSGSSDPGSLGTIRALVTDAPALPEHLAQKRFDAIVRAYDDILASGDENVRRIYDSVMRYGAIIDRYAQTHAFPRERIAAIIAQESQGNPSAASDAKPPAVGLMQLMPATATAYGAACGLQDPVQRTDPEQNVCTGTTYLRYLMDEHYPNDDETALAAYNAGEGNMNNQLALLPRGQPWSFWSLAETSAFVRDLAETNDYVPRVLAWDYIMRYLAATDAVPPDVATLVAGGGGGVRLTGRRGLRRRVAPSGWGGGYARDRIVVTMIPPTDAQPTNVWYTAHEGDRYVPVVAVLAADDPAAITALNRKIAEEGLAPGARLFLPEDRYAFYRADGTQTYAAIAQRYGMRTSRLLRLAGIWDDRDLAVAAMRDCDQSGCDDALRAPPGGTQVLVRRR